MIRGLVAKDRLLEWSVEDGWEPLCQFLGKPVPKDEPFPRTNDTGAYQDRVDQLMKELAIGAAKNFAIIAGCLTTLVVAGWKTWFRG